MKTYKVNEDFIKKAHSAACNEWKEKLEKQFPAAFGMVTIEPYIWYKDTRSGNPRLILTGENGIGDATGWGSDERWCSERYSFKNKYLKIALKNEVVKKTATAFVLRALRMGDLPDATQDIIDEISDFTLEQEWEHFYLDAKGTVSVKLVCGKSIVLYTQVDGIGICPKVLTKAEALKQLNAIIVD